MIINKFHLPYLLNEGDEFDNGGGDDIIDDNDEGDELEDVNLDAPEVGAGGAGLTPEAIAEAVARGIGNATPHGSAGGTPREPSFTEEQRREFLKKTGRPEVNEDLVAQLFGDGEAPVQAKRAALLQDLLDRSVAHALQIAGIAQNHHLSQVHERYGPLVARQQEELQTQFYSQVETKFPSLKGHQKIMKIAADKMRASGYVSKGPEADAQTLAIETARLIKDVDPNFTLKRAKSSGGRQGMPNMASSRSSAGGGGTNGVQRTRTMTKAQALYFAPKK
jgi:hypothetical protein